MNQVTANHTCSSHQANLLSRAAAVTVTLLLIGPVLRVPVQGLQLVRKHLFHHTQGFGYHTFPQSPALLWDTQVQRHESEAGETHTHK